MSKWIKWTGGEMPVPEGTPIKVKHRNGAIYKEKAGGRWASDWRQSMNCADIVAYKLRKGWKQGIINGVESCEVDVMFSDGSTQAITIDTPLTFEYSLWRIPKSQKVSESVDPYAELKAAYEAGEEIENFDPKTGTMHGTFKKGMTRSPEWNVEPRYYRIKPDPYKELKAAQEKGLCIACDGEPSQCWLIEGKSRMEWLFPAKDYTIIDNEFTRLIIELRKEIAELKENR